MQVVRGKIQGRSKVSLQNDVVMSGEFFHCFLYHFTVSNFFSCVVSDSLTLVLGDNCEKSFTQASVNFCGGVDVESIRQGI